MYFQIGIEISILINHCKHDIKQAKLQFALKIHNALFNRALLYLSRTTRGGRSLILFSNKSTKIILTLRIFHLLIHSFFSSRQCMYINLSTVLFFENKPIFRKALDILVIWNFFIPLYIHIENYFF